ncbi:MAG: type 4a pilus biogenesis protein PilO, partial [Gaiellaceae bacterium]
VGWFAFVSPQRSKADRLSGQVDAATSELSSDQQLLATSKRENTKGRAVAAKRALPDQPEVSNILRELNTLATQSRTELDNITPGAPTFVGTAEAIPITLSFKGRYFGLQKLLMLLRQSADVRGGKIVSTGRLYTVTSIGFAGGQAAPTGQSNGDIVASIALNAFLYSGVAAAPPTATTPTTTDTTAAAPTG